MKRTGRSSGGQADVFTTPPLELKWSDVKAFLEAQQAEDARIDYKADMTDRITESIAAMANSRGGVILVGIKEDPEKKTPLLPLTGISVGKHQGGGTLVTYCHTRLQPVFVPPHAYIGIPGQRGRGILVIQIRPDEAPIPMWDEHEGVLVRIGDQNRPADLSTLRALLAHDDERMEPVYRQANQLIGSMLQISGDTSPTSIVVGGIVRRMPGSTGWTSIERKELADLVRRSLHRSESLNIAVHSESIIASREEDPPVYAAFDEIGVIAIRIGWKKDPFPFAALIVGLRFALGLLLSKEVVHAYAPISPLELKVGFVNWPEHGIKTVPLFQPASLEAGRTSRTYHRVHRTYFAPAGSDPAPIIRRFTDTVLADAGYTDYEDILDQLDALAVDMVMRTESLPYP